MIAGCEVVPSFEVFCRLSKGCIKTGLSQARGVTGHDWNVSFLPLFLKTADFAVAFVSVLLVKGGAKLRRMAL